MAGTLKAWYPNHIHMTFDVRSRDLWPRDDSRSLVSILCLRTRPRVFSHAGEGS